MFAILLMVTVSQAAKLSFCEQEITKSPFQSRGDAMKPSQAQMDRALMPGFLRFQEDVCRCLPRRRHRPASVRAVLHIDPNKGETTVKYTIPGPTSRAVSRMVACLGEPTVTFEAYRYVSDMLNADGERIGQILRYPLLLELEGPKDKKAESKRAR